VYIWNDNLHFFVLYFVKQSIGDASPPSAAPPPSPRSAAARASPSAQPERPTRKVAAGLLSPALRARLLSWRPTAFMSVQRWPAQSGWIWRCKLPEPALVTSSCGCCTRRPSAATSWGHGGGSGGRREIGEHLLPLSPPPPPLKGKLHGCHTRIWHWW
jgi:hypothetical protein